MQIDLTRGSVAGSMLRFSLPLIAGNLLQQCYNITDTFIVSRISSDALAAVGTSYSVMTFLTSVILGLCMGSGALFSFCPPAGGPVCPLTRAGSLLSVPDGVSFGVLPPAAYFSRQRKVGKS